MSFKSRFKYSQRPSVPRTDAGREFNVDGTAQLQARLPNDVLLKGICSSERDDERSVRVMLLRAMMRLLRYAGVDVR